MLYQHYFGRPADAKWPRTYYLTALNEGGLTQRGLVHRILTVTRNT